MKKSNRRQSRPNYGIDAPNVIRNLIVLGFVGIIVSFFIPKFLSDTALYMGLSFIASGALTFLYAKIGKFRQRERILSQIRWKGSERVLDVGTGRGLLLIGAAKKLDIGQAYGIDIWNTQDLSGNAMTATQKNAEIEGVAAKVELKTEDARKMSFRDESFDVVVSNLALHNIPTSEGRAQACREVARVLKRGGTAVISDFQKTKEYMKVFKDAGLKVSRSKPYLADTFPPLRIVRAEKPI